MNENIFSNEIVPQEMPGLKRPDDFLDAKKTDATVEKIVSPEKKKIMEAAREERRGLLERYLLKLKKSVAEAKEAINKKIPMQVQVLASMTTEVSTIVLYAQAIRGKNSLNEKISPKERLLAILSGGLNDIAKLLLALAATTGNAEYAKLGATVYGASWVTLLAKNGREILHILKYIANCFELKEVSDLMAKSEETLEQYGYDNLENILELEPTEQ
ncbi:hypothetical protein HGA64_00920 [Candidatus Falkowbacteria bacterium]|nr:hypothetical protein [Candidatus Falkowbacteria bacterium]